MFVPDAKVRVGCLASSADLLPVVSQTCTVSPTASAAARGDAGCTVSWLAQVALPASAATRMATAGLACMDGALRG
ncbi:MAG: hypothetical protein JF589_17445 [Gemmatimonadetes bacterium]|nr:hypothetical protein [Gemmatimonadota bacterium]